MADRPVTEEQGVSIEPTEERADVDVLWAIYCQLRFLGLNGNLSRCSIAMESRNRGKEGRS